MSNSTLFHGHIIIAMPIINCDDICGTDEGKGLKSPELIIIPDRDKTVFVYLFSRNFNKNLYE